MTRSLRQLEASALTLLRNALSQGLDDAASIDYATRALGSEYAALVLRVHQRHFAVMPPN